MLWSKTIILNKQNKVTFDLNWPSEDLFILQVAKYGRSYYSGLYFWRDTLYPLLLASVEKFAEKILSF